MIPPPDWNLWSRFRIWERENRVKAQIAAIMVVAIGLIFVMFLVTVVLVFRTLR